MEPKTKVSKELMQMLNEAIARELQVSIQYMWQHVKWSGPMGLIVSGELKKVAIEEMKHAEKIAERLNYLGGELTTKPNEIRVGKNLKEQIKIDEGDEAGAIDFYKKIIEKARTEGDVVTRKMFESILEDEEAHHDTFISLLEQL
jgi:bacterioferritin